MGWGGKYILCRRTFVRELSFLPPSIPCPHLVFCHHFFPSPPPHVTGPSKPVEDWIQFFCSSSVLFVFPAEFTRVRACVCVCVCVCACVCVCVCVCLSVRFFSYVSSKLGGWTFRETDWLSELRSQQLSSPSIY